MEGQPGVMMTPTEGYGNNMQSPYQQMGGPNAAAAGGGYAAPDPNAPPVAAYNMAPYQQQQQQQQPGSPDSPGPVHVAFQAAGVAMPGSPGAPTTIQAPALGKAYDLMPGETLLNTFKWNFGGCCSQIGGICGGVDHNLTVTTERFITYFQPCCGGASCGAAGCTTQDVNNIARTVFDKELSSKYAVASMVFILCMWVVVVLISEAAGIKLLWNIIAYPWYLTCWLCIYHTSKFVWTRFYPKFVLTYYVTYQTEPEFELAGTMLLPMALRDAGSSEHALRIATGVVPPLQPGQSLIQDPTELMPGENLHAEVEVNGGIVKVTSARLIVIRGRCTALCQAMGSCCDREVLIEPITNVDKLVYDAVPYFGPNFRIYFALCLVFGLALISLATTKTTPSDDDTNGAGVALGVILLILGFVILLLRKHSILIGSKAFHGPEHDISLDPGCSDYSAKIEASIRFAQQLHNAKKKMN